MPTFYQSIAANKRQSFTIVIFFISFITLVAYFMVYAFELDPSIIPLALIFSGIGSFISYWFSDKIILAISKARPATKEEDYYFYSVAQNISIATGIKPKLYVIEDTAPNAFATGRDKNHAVVCCTVGLLQKLDRSELEAVVAHEFSHIKNYDMLLMSIVSILVGLITLLADLMLRSSFGRRNRKSSKDSGQISLLFTIVGLLLTLLSPIIAQLIQLAISRRREYFADASAVAITRQPTALISALTKISSDKEPLEAANKATAHLYIANPLKNHHDSIGWFAKLFNTHPPIKDRIQALSQI